MDEKTEAQGDITQLIGHETEIQPMLWTQSQTSPIHNPQIITLCQRALPQAL